MKLEARVVPLQDGGAEVLLPLELVLDEPVADAAGVEVLYRDALRPLSGRPPAPRSLSADSETI